MNFRKLRRMKRATLFLACLFLFQVVFISTGLAEEIEWGFQYPDTMGDDGPLKIYQKANLAGFNLQADSAPELSEEQAIELSAFHDFLQQRIAAYGAMKADCMDVINFYAMFRIWQKIYEESNQPDSTFNQFFSVYTDAKKINTWKTIANKFGGSLETFSPSFKTLGINPAEGSKFATIFKKTEKFTENITRLYKDIALCDFFAGIDVKPPGGKKFDWHLIKRLAKGEELRNVNHSIEKLLKKALKTSDASALIGKTKKFLQVANSVLDVLALGIALNDTLTSDDFRHNKFGSSYMVTNYISIGASCYGLLALFISCPCTLAIGLIAFVVCEFIHIAGKLNENWRKAYNDSFRFLYNQDPIFRSYLKEVEDGNWHDEEKSSAQSFYKKTYESEDGVEPVKLIPPANASEEELQDSHPEELLPASKRNAVLMTFYQQTSHFYSSDKLSMDYLSKERLKELWRRKADVMAHYITSSDEGEPEELVEDRTTGFWDSVGEFFSDSYDTVYNAVSVQDDLLEMNLSWYAPPTFNPDYVLLKKYQNFLRAEYSEEQNMPGSLRDIVNTRIELAPVNYLQLLEYFDTPEMSDEVLERALKADLFQIIIKELQYFEKTVLEQEDKFGDNIDTWEERWTKFKQTDQVHRLIAFRDELKEAYLKNKDEADSNGFQTSLNWNSTPTTSSIRGKYSGAQIFNVSDTPKENMDRALEWIYKYAWNLSIKIGAEQINNTTMDSRLKVEYAKYKLWKDYANSIVKYKNFAKGYFQANDPIGQFVLEGKMLDVEMDFWDWCSGIEAPIEILETSSEGLNEALEDYRNKVINFATTLNCKESNAKLNESLEELKQLISELEELNNETDFEDLKPLNNFEHSLADSSKVNDTFPEGGFKLFAPNYVINN